MSLADDGPLLIALDAAKRMLAATAQWAAIANDARIHFDALPAPDPGPDYTKAQMIAARPFALMWHELSGGFRLEAATSDLRCPIPSGKIVIQIELNVPSEHAANPTSLAVWINRLIGKLIRTGNPTSPGLWDLANTPGYLPVTSIDVDSYMRTNAKEATQVGDAIIFEFQLAWGHR